MERCCGTCKWHYYENIDEGFVCTNIDSEYCADLRNLWAGHETYFIYMGFPAHSFKNESKKTGGYSLVNVYGEWKFSRSVYYVNSLKDTEHFPVVGWIDFDRMVIDGIRQAINKED